MANYAAAGGSTTVGPTTGVASSVAGELDLGVSSVTNGFLKINRSGAANNVTISGDALAISSPSDFTFLLGTQRFFNINAGHLQFQSAKYQHILTFAATNDLSGTCVFAAATTCSITYSLAYTSTPAVIITPVNPGSVTFTLTTSTNTGFTITGSASNSLTVNYIVIGNPN
jgi:hypothetical protein